MTTGNAGQLQMRTSLMRAADDVATSLASYGLAGAILAVLVAPVLWVLVKGSQQREDERARTDRDDHKSRNDRAERMLQALETTVANQAEAIAEWRRYSQEEAQTHAAILRGLDKIADKLTP